MAWNADHLIEHDTGLAAPALIGQMLGDLREYGGRVASQIMAPIAVGERMPLRNAVESRRTQGRLLELWHLVGGQSSLYGNVRLAESKSDIQRLFFTEGLGLVDQLILEGQEAGRYSMSAGEFTDRFVPTLKPIEDYRTAYLDAAVEKFVAAENSSVALLAAVVLVTAVIFAILSTLILSARIHVFGPLLQAHEEVVGLAEERPIASRPYAARPGEMRRLFDAIDVLQEKLRERAFLTSQFKAQAQTDGLTGLLNRRMLDLVAQGNTTGYVVDETVCLILLDIDHFKTINDTHGHLAGDRVLVQIAELLRSRLRSTDIVARFGGEEFAILVSGEDLSGAVSLAKKTRLALENHEFTTPDGHRLDITASFGVAQGRRGLDEWLELAEAADTALYRAKADGRNRVRIARPTIATPGLSPTSSEVEPIDKHVQRSRG